MIEDFLTKIRRRLPIGAEEEAALRAGMGDVVAVTPGQRVVLHGVELDRCKLLLEGMVVRHKELRNGERQILEIHINGDFVDLHSYPLGKLDHDITALVPSRFVEISHQNIKALCAAFPLLARAFWFSTLLDASIQREAMLTLGRRPAVARIAHLFCELQVRLAIIGKARSDSYSLRLTQIELSEIVGLTPVHVNRTLRELRERGLVTFRNGTVDIHDLRGLRNLAEFTTDYLYLDQLPSRDD